MKKSVSISIVILLTTGLFTAAQDGSSNGKALNIPARKFGISIGNSHEFTGIRINFSDRDVKKINGLNVTFWPDRSQSFSNWYEGDVNYTSEINGISIGVLPLAGSMNFINIGLVAIGAVPGNLNGLTIGGLATAGANINGLSVSGLLTQANIISGVAVSGLLLGGTRGINGIAVSGIAVSSDISDIRGFASSPGVIYSARDFNGVGISGIFLGSGTCTFRGVAVSGFTLTDQMNGVSIALFNKTKELHGLQFGLVNFAGNNKEWSRILPFMNIHLAKNK